MLSEDSEKLDNFSTEKIRFSFDPILKVRKQFKYPR
jgi:hypothetical protein